VSVIYFDSSALVKLLIAEDGSDLAEELWTAVTPLSRAASPTRKSAPPWLRPNEATSSHQGNSVTQSRPGKCTGRVATYRIDCRRSKECWCARTSVDVARRRCRSSRECPSSGTGRSNCRGMGSPTTRASVSAGLRLLPPQSEDEHFEEVENSRDSGGQSSRTIIRG